MLKNTLFAIVCASQIASSQTIARAIDFNHHAWYSYSGDHALRGPWGLHFDGQWRRADLGTEWQQYQFRPGVNYRVSPNLLLTLGYAFTQSYPYGDFPNRANVPEHRTYQQALVTHSRRSLSLQHRVRLEQRFIRYPDPQPRSFTYQNRFRYLFKVDIPLLKNSEGRTTWYLPMFDEVLLGIAPNYGARPFDQNRFFIGIGRAAPAAKVEVGYMNQFIGQRNGRIFESNNTLFVTVTSNVPLAGLWGD